MIDEATTQDRLGRAQELENELRDSRAKAAALQHGIDWRRRLFDESRDGIAVLDHRLQGPRGEPALRRDARLHDGRGPRSACLGLGRADVEGADPRARVQHRRIGPPLRDPTPPQGGSRDLRRAQQQRHDPPRQEAHLLRLSGHHRPRPCRTGARGAPAPAAGRGGRDPVAARHPAAVLLLPARPRRVGTVAADRCLHLPALAGGRQPQHLPGLHAEAPSGGRLTACRRRSLEAAARPAQGQR